MAFVTGAHLPSSCRQWPHTLPTCARRPPRRVLDVRADASDGERGSESATSSPETKKMSVQERMAARLGREAKASKEESRARIETMEAENRTEKRNSINIALAAAAVGVVWGVYDRAAIADHVKLLHTMESRSISVDAALSGKRPAIVEFYADWCQTCKDLAPHMRKLQADYGGQVNFVLLNAETPKNQKLADDFHVDGIPHIAVVNRNGEVETNLIGAVPEEYIREDLDALLGGKPIPHRGFDTSDLF